jgi:hypothetical protein
VALSADTAAIEYGNGNIVTYRKHRKPALGPLGAIHSMILSPEFTALCCARRTGYHSPAWVTVVGGVNANSALAVLDRLGH